MVVTWEVFPELSEALTEIVWELLVFHVELPEGRANFQEVVPVAEV